MDSRLETYIVSDLRQIKALADPLRQRILAGFAREPKTTKQVATELGQPPTKLYHHVDMLEKAGLIKLIRTQPKRGTTEKYFQAIAHRFAIGAQGLVDEGHSALESFFSNAFAEAIDEIRKGVRNGCIDASAPENASLALATLRISRAQLPELRDAMLKELRRLSSSSSGEGEPYRVLLALYPAGEEADSGA